MTTDFTHRIATLDDIPAIRALMDLSIRELQKTFLTPEQIEASYELMGLDTQLIEDGTYFVIEAADEQQKASTALSALHHSEAEPRPMGSNLIIVGCGGWSWRNTLFGANHTQGRDASPLDPAKDPARVRAMYTHPDWARRGIGKRIIAICEDAARNAGFSKTRLAATLAGRPLYKACGYKDVTPFQATASNGIEVPLVTMEKLIHSDFH